MASVKDKLVEIYPDYFTGILCGMCEVYKNKVLLKYFLDENAKIFEKMEFFKTLQSIEWHLQENDYIEVDLWLKDGRVISNKDDYSLHVHNNTPAIPLALRN